MTIHLRPDLEAILQTKVAEGHFESVEATLEVAVRGLTQPTAADEIDPDEDLSWAKPYLAEADKAIAEGRTHSEEEAFAELEQRYGKL